MHTMFCRPLGTVRFNSHREIHWCRTQPQVCLPGRAKSWPEAPLGGRGAATGTDRRLLALAGLDGQISTSFVAEGGWFLANPRPTRLSMLAVTTSHAVVDLPMPRYQHCGQTQPPRQRFSPTTPMHRSQLCAVEERYGAVIEELRGSGPSTVNRTST